MSNNHNEDSKLDQILALLVEASQEKKVDIKHYVQGLYENLKSTEEAATSKIKDAAQTVDQSARKKPWIYIAAAALGGFIIGLFCHRRS